MIQKWTFLLKYSILINFGELFDNIRIFFQFKGLIIRISNVEYEYLFNIRPYSNSYSRPNNDFFRIFPNSNSIMSELSYFSSWWQPKGSISSTFYLQQNFALVDPKSVKITVKSSVSSYAFGIYKHKSCT